MYTLLRLTVVLGAGILYLAVWALDPNHLDGKWVLSFMSIPAAVLSFGVLTFRQLSSLSNSGLTSTEAGRLRDRKAYIRSRIYRLGAFAVITTGVAVFLIATGLHKQSAFLAGATGVLLGALFQYIFVLVRWLDQIAAFKDEQENLLSKNLRKEAALKQLKGT